MIGRGRLRSERKERVKEAKGKWEGRIGEIWSKMYRKERRKMIVREKILYINIIKQTILKLKFMCCGRPEKYPTHHGKL